MTIARQQHGYEQVPSLPETRVALLAPPVLSSTVRCLHLFATRPVLNLRAVCELMRKDPGATLCTFDLAADLPQTDARSERLEHCVAVIGAQNLLHALRARIHRNTEQTLWTEPIRFGVRRAHLCRTVAASLGLPPERAYLVGLFHSVCTPIPIPGSADVVLPPPTTAPDSVLLGLDRLPPSVRDALRSLYRQDPEPIWSALLHAADDLSATLPLSRMAPRQRSLTVF